MKNIYISLFASFFLSLSSIQPSFAQNETREFYELKLYRFTTPEQEARLDAYLSQAYLPALHKLSYNQIGVFKPIANATSSDKRIYVLIPMQKMEEAVSLYPRIEKDPVYVQNAKAYTDAAYNNPPYSRIETILLRAFQLAPQLTPPHLTGNKADRVYELRSYEGATEKYYWNKIHMFNQGDEIGLFKDLNFNAIFYGEVISGSRMPNLMYMTSFENMADHDKHWDAFVKSPTWKRLSTDPFYQNNIVKLDITLCHPAAYSDY